MYVTAQQRAQVYCSRTSVLLAFAIPTYCNFFYEIYFLGYPEIPGVLGLSTPPPKEKGYAGFAVKSAHGRYIRKVPFWFLKDIALKSYDVLCLKPSFFSEKKTFFLFSAQMRSPTDDEGPST